MGNVVFMQVLNRLSDIQEHLPYCILSYSFFLFLCLGDKLSRISTIGVLQEYVKVFMLIIKEAAIKLNNVGVVEGGQYSHLIQRIG
jgi:hypothetical protein